MSVNETDPPPGAAGGLGSGERGACDEATTTTMRVLVLDPAGGTLARCAGIDGVVHTIETALVGPLEPRAVVLVQHGVAILRLDAEWTP